MTDWYSPRHVPPAKPQPVPGERIWTLRKNADVQTAELRTSAAGVELQCAQNGEWFYGRRHETRELALAEAALLRADLEKSGWVAES